MFSLFVLSQLYIYKKGLNFKLIFLSALLLGAATFTRAVSMYVSIVVIFTMLIVFWKDESKVKIAKYLIVFISIQMMIIGGWQIRNQFSICLQYVILYCITKTKVLHKCYTKKITYEMFYKY